MKRPIEFTIPTDDFDTALLPVGSRNAGAESFKTAVTRFYEDQFAEAGGSIVVGITEREIQVRWVPTEGADLLRYAVRLLSARDYVSGVPLLESLNEAEPESPVILFNLGMAYSDLGRLDEARQHLERAVGFDPQYAAAWVALGVAQGRSGMSKEAIASFRTALEIEPGNAYAERNLAASLGNAGFPKEAEEHFRRAVALAPNDPAATLGLAQAVESLGRFDEAEEIYLRTIGLAPESPIAEVAKQARSAIANRAFRIEAISQPRPDAVMYCLAAIEEFEVLAPAEIQAIVFEIAALGQGGLSTNEPARKYTLRSLPGREFSGLLLVSMMYVGFKQIDPSVDVGFDLSKEYEQARALRQAKKG